MKKDIIHQFSLKLAKPTKVTKPTKNLSRLCLATVIIDDGIFKAKINANNSDVSPDFIVVPFDENTIKLKGKTHVFTKTKDKRNRHICIIREQLSAKINPGTDDQYSVLKEGIIVSGRIAKVDDQMQFEYEEFVSFGSRCEPINKVRIVEDKPLFVNEHTTCK